MVAYVIVERIEEWDSEVFAAYRPLAAASIDKFGGRYLALSKMPVVLEGEGRPIVMAVIEFPSMEQADCWYNSEEYQKAASIRRGGARNRFIAVDAVAS
jgi:uncharacterized protein (DUF1330 family)